MTAPSLERRLIPAPGATLACWHRPGNGTRWILFLHGAAGNHLMWKAQFDQFPGADLLFLDVRGQGESGLHAGQRTSFESVMDDLDIVLKEYGVDKAILVGHSWGGNPVQEFAYLHPDRVSGLVLLGAWGQHRTWGRKEAIVLAICNGVYRVIPWHWFARKSAQLCSDNPETQAEVLVGLEATGRQVWLDLGNSAYKAVHEVSDYPARTPTLLIRGDRDAPKVLESIYGDICRKNPAARQEVIPGTKHTPNMDTPDEFNRLLAGFVDQLDHESE